MYPQSESKYRGTGCGKAARPDLKGSGEATNRSTWKKITLLLFLNTLILCSFAQIHEDITVNQADSLITTNSANPNFIILDVRTSSEYSGGHIKHAINIDYYSPTLRTQLNLLNKNDVYLVYCHLGGRSASAMDTMQVLGFIETYNMLGGIDAWILAGYQVVINDPPVVGDIPNQEVSEGTSFTAITLDDFVSDVDDADSTMIWTATGQSNLSVDITDRVATITPNDPDWNGSETITFTAEDPLGGQDSDTVTFTVTPVNDPPVVSDISDQTIAEGQSFGQINLDNFVYDIDHADDLLTWTAMGQSDITVSITDRVANFTMNPDWNGSDTIVFLAEDPLGGQDSDTVIFTVTPVNDSPVVSDILDQDVLEGQSSALEIVLDDLVVDVDDPDSVLTWTVDGEQNVTVSVVNRIAYITPDDTEWNGSDTLIFTATDPLGASDTDTCIYTVMPVNDPPTLNKAIPDTSAEADKAFSFILDPNTFADADLGDSLVYSATISKEGITPDWITFEPTSRTFSGTPADDDKGMLEVIVTVTDDSLASVADTFNIEVKSYVGINNPLAGLEIKLYPNPNTGRFVIESETIELKDVVLEIFNEKGQLIWVRKIKDEMGTLRESVDLSNSPEGLYLLSVRINSGVLNKWFVISY